MDTKRIINLQYLFLIIVYVFCCNLEAATDPSPKNGWENTDLATILIWTPSQSAISSKVYFGTDSTPDETEFRSDQTQTSYVPGILNTSTNYYWRIDEVDANHNVSTGTVWNFWTASATPGTINKVTLMPDRPANYFLRDWKNVAIEFDRISCDFNSTGTFLPIPFWDITYNFDNFVAMPSFVSHWSNTGALGTMANVVGASLCGVDKSNYDSLNYVTMQSEYYSIYKGLGIIYNSPNAGPVQSFWYQIIANIMYWQLTNLYPSIAANTQMTGTDSNTYTMNEIVQNCADKWYEASEAMDGNYAHYGFNFSSMTPSDDVDPNDGETSTLLPHSAGGIGWLEYTAYKKFNDSNYLKAADWGIEYLHNLSYNPAHDILVPYGVVCAARMNAELDRNYNVGKMMNWHFDEDSLVNAHAGVAAGISWGTIPVDGLVGKPGLEKVYACNTFNSVGTIAPVARYDQRYAHDIGKWILNLASNARYLYSDFHDADHQNNKDWSDVYDPCSSISYEFLANQFYIFSRADSDYSHTYGTVENDYLATQWRGDDSMTLVEETVGTVDRLHHIWDINLPDANVHKFVVRATYFDAGDADDGFSFYFSKDPNGPWTHILDFNSPTQFEQAANFGTYDNLSGKTYFKIEDRNQTSGNTNHDSIQIEFLLVQNFEYNITPALSGGYMRHGGKTNLCFYQAAHVGYLGGIIEPTNRERILQIDLLATDFYHDSAYPSYLYYNPWDTEKSVQIDVGKSRIDIYDTITHTFLLTDVNNVNTFYIPAYGSRVLVLAPTNKTITYTDRKMLVDGVVVDYYHPVTSPLAFADGFESGDFTTGDWSTAGTMVAVKTEAKCHGSWGAKLSKTTWIQKSLSTVGFNNIHIRYNRQNFGYDSGENLYIEWSIDGNTWNNLETVSNATYNDGQQDKLCGSGANNNAGFRVRFRTNADLSTEYSFVDDIEITGSPQ